MQRRDALRELGIPARVLVVSDQPVLTEIVRLAVNHGQFVTRIAPDGAVAATSLPDWQPHLAIVDMDVAGPEFLHDVGGSATEPGRIPVIALTRRGDLATKLAAFDLGVDDILTVPFPPEELVARTFAVIRRTYWVAIPFKLAIRVGALEIDILHRRVRAGHSEIHLTSLEQSLLYLLAANAGRLVTREEIL